MKQVTAIFVQFALLQIRTTIRLSSVIAQICIIIMFIALTAHRKKYFVTNLHVFMVCLHTQPNMLISDTVSDVPANQFIGIYIDTVRRKAQCHTPILFNYVIGSTAVTAAFMAEIQMKTQTLVFQVQDKFSCFCYTKACFC
jgi:hypothetical protein